VSTAAAAADAELIAAAGAASSASVSLFCEMIRSAAETKTTPPFVMARST